ANELIAGLIPEIAMGCQRALSKSIGDDGRFPGFTCLCNRVTHTSGQIFYVVRYQFAAWLSYSVPTHQACGMRVRKGNRDLFRPNSGALRGRLQQLSHIVGKQKAQIDGDNHLFVFVILCLEGERGSSQGPMNPGGSIMGGGTPCAMIDADWRSNIPACDAAPATALRGVDV